VGLFLQVFWLNFLCHLLLSRSYCRAVPLIILDLLNMTVISKEYKLWSSLLCSFIQPFLLPHLQPSIHLSTIFLNVLNLCLSPLWHSLLKCS
jgi:hypothetical protein